MPTLKQEQAVKNLLDTNGNVAKAMKMAGYTKATANQPAVLTQSKGFKELMQKYLPAQKLFKAHEDALEADKYNDFTGEREPDHRTRLDAAKVGYKLYGIGETNNPSNNTQINISLGDGGYIPPDNVLSLKPTYLTYKRKLRLDQSKPQEETQ